MAYGAWAWKAGPVHAKASPRISWLYTLREHVGKGREAAGSTCCIQCPLIHLCVCPTPAHHDALCSGMPAKPSCRSHHNRASSQPCFHTGLFLSPDSWCCYRLSCQAELVCIQRRITWIPIVVPFFPSLLFLNSSQVSKPRLWSSWAFTSLSVPIFPERVRFFATRPHSILCDPAGGYCGMDVKCPSSAHVLVHLVPV